MACYRKIFIIQVIFQLINKVSLFAATPPAQKVQFIIGENNEDEDHRPHDIFCEMDELRGVEGEREWKETARWIKFEEDVEEGAEKWSKPHVATLSLHSLFELRKQITTGTILLDISGENLKDVIQLVLESMVNNDLDPSQKQAVFDVLMSRHKHQHETTSGIPIIRSLADIGKKHSEKKLDDKGMMLLLIIIIRYIGFKNH